MGWGQGRAWPILTGERAHYELAAGHDVTPYIKAMEQFSSFGGMLPEQVWDYADLPSEGMYFGRSAGSAQPLVWAHAEYLKLLRSVADGKVFDRISVVADRYARSQRQAHLPKSPRDLPDSPPDLHGSAGKHPPHHGSGPLSRHLHHRCLGHQD